MPCYDKKLEGSRDDFYNSILHTRDVRCGERPASQLCQVDCVLTTGELEQLSRTLSLTLCLSLAL